MKKIEDKGLHCHFTANANRDKIVYILAPEQMPTEDVHQWADRCNCNIAIVYVMDWNNDLTPWQAQGLHPGASDFEGNAKKFLSLFISDTMPMIEKTMGCKNPRRALIGISLSGLFSLWAWLTTDCFESICSISGSFWYDGLVDWVKSQEIGPKPYPIFMTLGRLEPESKNKMFASVGEATSQIIATLKDAGVDVEFQWTEGDHHSLLKPRFEKCFDFLSAQWN